MRNLKRALSLTLASVMLLGMMVVGSSAAKGYPDVTEEDNVEAIEVLQAIGVMQGNADNGNFEPDRSVTRTEMAVVMALLLKLDYQYYEASCPFWDVPTWAKPYVGACYANGIVSGYGDGTYGALDSVTAVQAASMMMRALGYFQHSEDYATGFETATVKQGTEIGIFKGVGSSATADMTRNQVAKMALNALQSEMVSFTGTPGTSYTSASGETLSIGYRAEYTPRTSTELKYQAIEDRTSDVASELNHKGQYYIQLGEELFDGELTKKYARDDFERPSINWQYKGKEIGTYVDYELKVGEYVTGVTGAEMYDLLTYTTINDNDLLNYVDGVDGAVVKANLARSNKNNLAGTGTGVLTEVFFDQSREEIIITSINTYLAKANSDYNTNNETLSLKVYQANKDGVTKVVDIADVPEIEDVAKDQFVLVYMSGKDNSRNYAVVEMFDVEILTDSTVTKFTKDDGAKVVDKLTSDGTEYKTNPKAFYDNGAVLDEYDQSLLTNMSYNIYLDRYGNAIGVDLYEGNRNYVFITGYDRIDSHISVKTADAAAIFTDGTMDVITVNVTDTNKYIDKVDDTNANYVQWGANGNNGVRDLNRWYTYTENNNGTYTLKPVERFFYTSYVNKDADGNQVVIPAASSKVLNSANLYVDDSRPTNSSTVLGETYTNKGRAYGNDNSIYITVEPGTVDYTDLEKLNNRQGTAKVLDAITDVKGVYTGIQNVKIELNENTQEEVNFRKSVVNSSWDVTEKDAYVYTVYDSNFYIVASVILGDAQGSAANYAYILSDAKSERVEVESGSRATGDSTYYWEFDAVVNGEKQTLTAKTKYSSVFSGLEKYHVQELRFDGEYVTAIKDVATGKIQTNNTDNSNIDRMDVYDVGHCLTDWAYEMKTDTHASLIGDDYPLSDRIDGTIYLEGRTLYAERNKTPDPDIGLPLASTDTKAVLVQYENGERTVTSGITVSDAVGRLADADEVNENGIQFRGRIVAVLKDGVAQWVVIISDTNLTVGRDPNYGSGNVTVKFRPGDYSDERNVFYDGVNKLSYANGDFTHVDGTFDSFRVKNGSTVQIVRTSSNNEAFGTAGTRYIIGYYDDLSDYVVGTVYGNGYILEFTANKSCTLWRPGLFDTLLTVSPEADADFDGDHFSIVGESVEETLTSLTKTFVLKDKVSRAKVAGDPEKATEFTVGNYYTVEYRIDNGKVQVAGPVRCVKDGELTVTVSLGKAVTDGFLFNKDVDVFFGSIYVSDKNGSTVPGTPGEPDTPVVGQPITEITLSGFPTGEVTAPYTTAVKTDKTGTTVSTATVNATGTVTLTVTTTHADGFAADLSVKGLPTGWTVVSAPAAGAKTFQITGTVTVKDDGSVGTATAFRAYSTDGVTYTLGSYKKADLTESQIKEAIAAVAKVPVSQIELYKNSDGRFTSGSIKSTDGTAPTSISITNSSISSIAELFKVSVNGKEEYYKNGDKIGGLGEIQALLLKGEKNAQVDQSDEKGLSVTGGVATLANLTADREYVTALKLGTIGTVPYSGKLEIQLDNGNWTDIVTTATSAILPGTSVRLNVATGVTSGESIITQVNGKTASIDKCVASGTTVSSSEKLVGKAFTVTGADATTKAVDIDFIKDLWTVYVGTSKQTNSLQPEKEGLYAASDTVALLDGTYVANNSATPAQRSAGITVSGQSTTVAANQADLEGVITYNKAVQATSATNCDYFFAKECATTDAVTAGGYVPVGTTLYARAKAENTVLAITKTDPVISQLTQVVAPNATTKGVWSFTVPETGPLDADELVITKSMSGVQDDATDLTGANGSDADLDATITVVGLSGDVTARWDTSKFVSAELENIKIEASEASGTITITLKDCPNIAAGQKGSIIVTMDGFTTTINLTTGN